MVNGPVISNGTQIVSDDRRVGEVVGPPDDLGRYLVRFADHTESRLGRSELTPRKTMQIEAYLHRQELTTSYLSSTSVILRAVVGSRAFDLDTETSDTDVRGFFVAPPPLALGLEDLPGHAEVSAEEVYWEIRHGLRLALQANPNLLETLYSPMVQHITPIGEELLAIRGSLLSKFAFDTYAGYTLSQFKRIESAFRNRGEPKWKHVMHLLRLLISGTSLMRDGSVMLGVGEYRDRLLEVKAGEVLWDDCEAWRMELHREFESARDASPLPERPDTPAIDAWLVSVRRRADTPEGLPAPAAGSPVWTPWTQ